MTPRPDISLPRFEGPLDLLLELVRKNEIDISDIPIAEITRQYLAYLHRAEALDMELGSEFAYMAALLIHIKSRSLLACDPEIAKREEDPRQELVRLLLDHDQVRQAAEFLKEKLEVAGATWTTSSINEYLAPAVDETRSHGLNLLEVLRLAQQALDAARMYEIVSPPDSVTVDHMMRWLEQRLARAPGRCEAERLFAEQAGPRTKVVLFLAMLEMVKATRLQVEQEQCFGPVLVSRTAQLCPDVE